MTALDDGVLQGQISNDFVKHSFIFQFPSSQGCTRRVVTGNDYTAKKWKSLTRSDMYGLYIYYFTLTSSNQRGNSLHFHFPT